MNKRREFSQNLAKVSRLWDAKEFDAALITVEALRREWPGNAHLLVLWAKLVQLQESPSSSLSDAKAALQDAVGLEAESPVASIELGYFLDNVDDDPKAAVKVFSHAVEQARQLMLDALFGQAKALRQLSKQRELTQCLARIIQLARFEKTSKGTHAKSLVADAEITSAKNGIQVAIQFDGARAGEIEEMLGDLFTSDLMR